MSTLVLTQAEVRRLLPMEECVGLMAEVLTALARGDGVNPLRQATWLPDRRGLIGTMPGFVAAPASLGVKIVTVFPGNHGTELDAHQGVVVVFDSERGVPIGILDASEITAIRTAAVSAVATGALAREDAGDLALIGAGIQGRAHLEAVRAVRDLRRVRAYSRTRARLEAFCARESERHGIEVEPSDSAEDAVRGADIVCTTTSASVPVLHGAWLSSGAHVNAVGACVKSARELDSAAVANARLFVDRRESALNESGDVLFAIEEGAIDAGHIAGELGDVLRGAVSGRGSAGEITLFESLGLAVEDLAAAHRVLEHARAEGVGTELELGGRADA